MMLNESDILLQYNVGYSLMLNVISEFYPDNLPNL